MSTPVPNPAKALQSGKTFITDGGLETTLIFHNAMDLPQFAAFDVIREQSGKKILQDYFALYAAIARTNSVGMILESPTWRASIDWGQKMGYSAEALDVANRECIEMLEEVRKDYETPTSPMVISGCIGPRGDGYETGALMTASEAQRYHAAQIESFAESAADVVSALTMTNTPEAIGIVRAAQEADMPVVISFTVETDGRLPSGQSLKDAILETDQATGSAPLYYMINCAHPTHFQDVLETDAAWVKRIQGLRANASKCSHAELDEAQHLDDGDPQELGRNFADITKHHDHINILGGCCGTDHRHIESICKCVLNKDQAA